MWRAFLLGIGISLFLIGGECLVLDKVILADHDASRVSTQWGEFDLLAAVPQRELVPPEWAPWSLLAGGAIVVLYSRSLGAGAGA